MDICSSFIIWKYSFFRSIDLGISLSSSKNTTLFESELIYGFSCVEKIKYSSLTCSALVICFNLYNSISSSSVNSEVNEKRPYAFWAGIKTKAMLRKNMAKMLILFPIPPNPFYATLY